MTQKPKKPFQKTDIIHPRDEIKSQVKKYSYDNKVHGHDIITNQIQEQTKIQPIKKKNINEKVFRDFNIVTNRYWKNHKEKFIEDKQVVKTAIKKRLENEKVFDMINCQYYN